MPIKYKITAATLILGLFLCGITPVRAEEKTKNKEEWAIVLHGGAGAAGTLKMPVQLQAEYRYHLENALNEGKKVLIAGGTALDAVSNTVLYLENCPLFNAGKGAVLTAQGTHELDAAIMDGSNLEAGAVAGVKNIKNPIRAARAVMEASPHVLLSGEGAQAFAIEQGLDTVPNSYFTTDERKEQLQRILAEQEVKDPKGTVGCVALDRYGNLAAATSTGGMSGKQWGRVGDSPIIGAGTYANNATVAVSGTGHGELWIRRSVAFDINALMDYKGLTVQQAAEEVIYKKITPMGGSGGGVICVDKDGNMAAVYNTELMFRAWGNSSGDKGCAIYKDTLDSCPVAYNTTYWLEKDDLYRTFPISSKDYVMVGDDLVDRGIWNEFFGTDRIKNRGIATETSAGTAVRLPQLTAQHPAKLFICTGTNDLKKGFRTPQQVAREVAFMALEAAQNSPSTQVYVVGLPPTGSEQTQTNRLLAEALADPGIGQKGKKTLYIDFPQVSEAADFEGLSMNAAGYCKWAAVLAPYLKMKLLAKPADVPYPGHVAHYLHRMSLFHSLPVQKGKTVMLGNSLNNNCRWEELIPGENMVNRGISGDVLSGILERIQPVIDSRPERIFLQSSTNDFINDANASADTVWADYVRLIKRLREALPDTPLYVISNTLLNPKTPYYEGRNPKLRHINRLLRDNAARYGYTYLDISGPLTNEAGDLADKYTFDGIHLRAAAYQIWKEAVWQVIHPDRKP